MIHILFESSMTIAIMLAVGSMVFVVLSRTITGSAYWVVACAAILFLLLLVGERHACGKTYLPSYFAEVENN